MKSYRPSAPFNVPLKLLIPSYADLYGVPTTTFPSVENGILIYGSFKTFGGTDTDSNGILSVENTAVVETWYRPDIKSNCKIAVLQTGEIYDILGEPENIELRNQYLRIRVRQVKGGS